MSFNLAHMSDVYYAGNTAANTDVSISWLAIVLAVIAAMAIGSIWYGPLFGKRWLKLVGLTKKDTGKGWQGPMIVMLGLAVLQAFVLSHFIAYTADFYGEFSKLAIGVITGLWAFVGFVAPVLVSNALFSKGSVELLKLNLGNQLVTLIVIGAIIGAVN